jgi:hypothetical protein
VDAGIQLVPGWGRTLLVLAVQHARLMAVIVVGPHLRPRELLAGHCERELSYLIRRPPDRCGLGRNRKNRSWHSILVRCKMAGARQLR